MNSDEIRAMIPRKGINFKEILCDDPKTIILYEIAAQLADLNESIKSFDKDHGTRILDVKVRHEE